MNERFTTVRAISAAYAKALPAEQEQIRGFVARVGGRGVRFFLMKLRHHDTGKPILTVGCGLAIDCEGIPTEEMKRLIGAPKPVTAQAPLTRKPLLGGGRK